MTQHTVFVPCRFGSEAFDVYVDAGLAPLFAREFSDSRDERVPKAVFRFHRGGEDSRAAAARETPEDRACGESHLAFANRHCRFEIRFSDPIHVEVHLRRSRRMALARRAPVWLQRSLTRKFNSVDEQEYGYLVYQSVLWILFLSCLRSGGLFLHASGVQHGDRAFLLCGTGGVGKTSLSARLLAMPGARFIADDIAVVGVDGTAYPNGMFVHVYPYNRVEAALNSVSSRAGAVLDRLHWRVRRRLYGPKGVCRRLSPFELHGGETRDFEPRRLTDIVWLVDEQTAVSPLRDVDAATFATAHLEVLEREIASAFAFYEQARGTGWRPEAVGLPGELAEHVRARLEQLAGNVRVRQFHVSRERSPEQNAAALLDGLED